jgi:hypothetical protein
MIAAQWPTGGRTLLADRRMVNLNFDFWQIAVFGYAVDY